MRYIFSSLIPSYYAILNGAITVNSVVLPVYDGEVPPTQQGSYILLGDRNSTPMDGKGTQNTEVFLLVDVVIKGASMGFKDSDYAANQITALINKDANPSGGVYWQVVTTNYSTNTLGGINKTDNIFRTLIRFRHICNQIS